VWGRRDLPKQTGAPFSLVSTREGPRHFRSVCIHSSFQGPSRDRGTRRLVQCSRSSCFGSGALRHPASFCKGAKPYIVCPAFVNPFSRVRHRGAFAGWCRIGSAAFRAARAPLLPEPPRGEAAFYFRPTPTVNHFPFSR